MTALDGGGFLIASLFVGAYPTYHLYSQRFDETGATVGSEVLVSDKARRSNQTIELSDGRFAHAWVGTDSYVYMRYQHADGTFGPVLPLDDTLQIDYSPLEYHIRVAETGNGSVFAVYATVFSNGVVGIYGNISSNETSFPRKIAIATSSAGSAYPAIITLADGRVMVVWSNVDSILGKIFLEDGTSDGGVFEVGSIPVGVEIDPLITLLPDGRVLVTWNIGSSPYSAQGQYLDPRTSAIDFDGTAGDDFVGATAFADTLDGKGGVDHLHIDRSTSSANISVSLANPAAIQTLPDGLTFVNFEQIRIETGSGNDTIVGGALSDMITTGAGNDFLDGGVGADTLTGGSGNDSYIVDNAADKVFEAAGGGADKVYASVSYVLAAGQEIETLRTTVIAGIDAINLTGNELGQTLMGNAGSYTAERATTPSCSIPLWAPAMSIPSRTLPISPTTTTRSIWTMPSSRHWRQPES